MPALGRSGVYAFKWFDPRDKLSVLQPLQLRQLGVLSQISFQWAQMVDYLDPIRKKKVLGRFTNYICVVGRTAP